jgi:hypothetical protein
MPSAFPGINPHLEQEDVWHDFHERFIPAAAEALLPQVLPDYIVKIDQHAYIHELPASERRFVGRPDIAIGNQRGASAEGDLATTVADAPVYGQIPLAVDVEKQSYLEIRDRFSRELVTVIELLSPSNKAADREQYLGKREQFLRSSVHFIELDLLRGGLRLPVEGLPGCDYYAMVSRATERPRVGLWPIQLSDSLPPIPVPLRHGHVDATLDLQQILNRVFDAAGYQFYVYANGPQPPLSPEQTEWSRSFISRSL